ncbi:endonuclease/exonuclease/phosphatase family protein [Candidatus Spongiihabitans sp.]|uniref:endonuclease/exonuclease/phosphatase family protein n=1 Tax=Candidatus Spongiihabitans sp. TaxID=3101308 RepID=UPI003C7E05A9
MKLVSYNIRFGLGPDQKIDLERIADTVKDADIIALQEVERFWKRSGMTDQPEIISSYLKKYYGLYFPAFDVDASVVNDDGSILNRRRQFGPMVISRWPIRMARYIVFPKLGTTDSLTMDTGAIECIVDTPSGPLMIYSLHLSAVSSRDRLMQIDRLLEFYRNAPVSGGSWTGGDAAANPVELKHRAEHNWSNDEPIPIIPKEAVVMGDFNMMPDGEEYNRMVGAPDPFVGRVGHLDSFLDSWTVARERSNDRSSWFPDPCEREPGYPTCLDYCFISPHLSQKVARVWVDQDVLGSDHKPVWVELDF